MSRMTTYRRCTINTVAAAALVGAPYLAAAGYAAASGAPSNPLYGACGLLALGLSLFAGFLVIEDRRTARQQQPAAIPDERVPDPALIGDIDNAPTMPVVIRARVPAPRSHVYRCPPEDTRAPMTVEMAPARQGEVMPVEVVAEQFARLYRYLKPDEERRWADGLDAAAAIALPPPDSGGSVN